MLLCGASFAVGVDIAVALAVGVILIVGSPVAIDPYFFMQSLDNIETIATRSRLASA